MAARRTTGRVNTSITGTPHLRGQGTFRVLQQDRWVISSYSQECVQTVISGGADVLSEGVSLLQKLSAVSFFTQLFAEVQPT